MKVTIFIKYMNMAISPSCDEHFSIMSYVYVQWCCYACYCFLGISNSGWISSIRDGGTFLSSVPPPGGFVSSVPPPGRLVLSVPLPGRLVLSVLPPGCLVLLNSLC